MMQIFTRRKVIPLNLDDVDLERLMTFPSKENAALEEFFVKKIYHKDHVQIGMNASKTYNDGIHDFEYDRVKKN